MVGRGKNVLATNERMTIRNLQHLRTLIRVAETGRFALAARDMRLSEAAISMQMRQLEQDLNTQIFDRSSHRPILNQKGRLLVEMARHIVRLTEDIDDALTGTEQVSGVLRLGAINSALEGVVPPALAQLRAKHPQITFSVVDALSEDLRSMLERGDLDCALLLRPSSIAESYNWHPLAREPFDVVMPNHVRSDDIQAIFADHPYIRFTRRLATGKIVDVALQARGIMVRPVLELGISRAIARLVHQGLGVSILPREAVIDTGLPLRRMPFFEGEVYRELGLMERVDNIRLRTVAALFEELRTVAAARSNDPMRASAT